MNVMDDNMMTPLTLAILRNQVCNICVDGWMEWMDISMVTVLIGTVGILIVMGMRCECIQINLYVNSINRDNGHYKWPLQNIQTLDHYRSCQTHPKT